MILKCECRSSKVNSILIHTCPPPKKIIKKCMLGLGRVKSLPHKYEGLSLISGTHIKARQREVSEYLESMYSYMCMQSQRPMSNIFSHDSPLLRQDLSLNSSPF